MQLATAHRRAGSTAGGSPSTSVARTPAGAAAGNIVEAPGEVVHGTLNEMPAKPASRCSTARRAWPAATTSAAPCRWCAPTPADGRGGRLRCAQDGRGPAADARVSRPSSGRQGSAAAHSTASSGRWTIERPLTERGRDSAGPRHRGGCTASRRRAASCLRWPSWRALRGRPALAGSLISGTSASCQKLSSIMMPSGSCRKTCCSGRAGTLRTSNGTSSFLIWSIVPRMSAQLIATWSMAPPPWSLRPLSETRCRIAFSPA